MELKRDEIRQQATEFYHRGRMRNVVADHKLAVPKIAADFALKIASDAVDAERAEIAAALGKVLDLPTTEKQKLAFIRRFYAELEAHGQS